MCLSDLFAFHNYYTYPLDSHLHRRILPNTRLTTWLAVTTTDTTDEYAEVVLGITGLAGSSWAWSSSAQFSSSSSSRKFTQTIITHTHLIRFANVSQRCITARRRRKRGYQPYRGTGWTLGRTPPGHGQATYNNQPQYAQYAQNQNQYQAPQQPYYNNSNNPPPSYYDASANRGGNNDVELQSPQPAYGGHGSQYQPPKGPPPNNHY